MMPDDQPRLFPDHLRARHARVTIRIHEVNIPGDKNVLIIRAARRQNQRAENRDLKNDERKTSDASHRIDNYKSTIENRKLKSNKHSTSTSRGGHPFAALKRNWARQDSNLGPRDYESPALTAELQAGYTDKQIMRIADDQGRKHSDYFDRQALNAPSKWMWHRWRCCCAFLDQCIQLV